MFEETIIEEQVEIKSKLDVRLMALDYSMSLSKNECDCGSECEVCNRPMSKIVEDAKLVADFLIGENSTLPENLPSDEDRLKFVWGEIKNGIPAISEIFADKLKEEELEEDIPTDKEE